MVEKPRSELEGLFADAEEADVDRRLRECLTGKIAIERSTGRVLVKPELYKLVQQERILVLLLARQAGRRLGLPGVQLEVDPTILAAEAQVDVKNCREYLSRFKAKRVIERGKDGYYVADWNLLLVIDRVADRKENTGARTEPKSN